MYLTGLEEARWQVIKKILKLQDRKRKYDLSEIWDAIFNVVKIGCQWRMLPSDSSSLYFSIIVAKAHLLVNLIY